MQSSNLRMPLALQVVKAVLSLFIGICRRIDMQADLDRLPLVPVIVGGLIAAAVFVGDLHELNTLQYQPAKIAAIEGIWKTEKGAPLVLFAVPNENTRSNGYAIEIPNGAALILTHDSEGELRGLDEFESDRMSIWDVAAHPSALKFMLWGAAIVLPFIVGYTLFA